MKKILIIMCISPLLSACSPVDSTRVLDQKQTEALVNNMYPVKTNLQLMAPVTQSKR